MRRRDLIKATAGLATAWPIGARAQQTRKLPTVGFMGAGTSLIYSEWVNAFLERLREHGWTEGRTVAIEYRWAEGSYERAADIAAEFVRMKVDVIVTASTPNTLATKKRRQKSRLFLRQPATRLAATLSQVLRDQAAMSLVCQSRQPRRPASASNCYAKHFTLCRDWRSWAMATTVQWWWKCVRLRQLQRSSVSTQLRSRSGALKTSDLHLKRSEGTLMRFSFLPSRWQIQTGDVSVHSLLLCTCRHRSALQNTSRRVGLCLMGQTSQTFIGEPPILLTKFYAAQNQRRCRSSSRPSSISRSI
jgi:hypothetical protein